MMLTLSTLALAVLVPAAALTLLPGDPEGQRVSAGTWGGRGARLEVTAKGGTVELDCAHGSLDEPLRLGADGSFDVKGTFVLERGGPVRMDADDKGEAVRYRGRLDGETLSLAIVKDGDPPKELGKVKVGLGQPVRLRKCL